MTVSSQFAKLWESDQTEDADTARLESTRQRAQPWWRQGIQQQEDTDVTGLKLEYRSRQLASLLSGMTFDVCFCPKIQNASP